jgi:pyruvate/2-oxoglutarate dehydrogenase complex dihydrolipoamide acyltransferase (E2) component
MKLHRCSFVFALGLGICQFAIAQAPAGAPAGSTGQCKDGSYTSAPKKAGACRGHKGVQQWFAADASAPAASTKSATTAAPAATPAPAPAPTPAASPAPSPRAMRASTSSNAAAAPGGGPGMVWVNTPTKVYHCPGSRYYGKTKEGQYMTETQAKAGGAHPDHGKGCGQ